MSRPQLIIFDLDGVLVDTKLIHFDTLNEALRPHRRPLTYEEHLRDYDGLSTQQKLTKLSQTTTSLSLSQRDDIWQKKQQLTHERLDRLSPNPVVVQCFRRLQDEGYLLAVASNCTQATVTKALTQLGLRDYCQVVLSNSSVQERKPHPEIYWRIMMLLGVSPAETLIFEDAPRGLRAAHQSGARVSRVSSLADITYEYVRAVIESPARPPAVLWDAPTMNVIIPMAGEGRRFEQAGFTRPKPLIPVMQHRPMIDVAVRSLGIAKARFVYVVQRAHREAYQLDTVLNLITPGCTLVEVNGVTEGAACTLLAAKSVIDTTAPLFIANSDQYVEWQSLDFFYTMQELDADGGIVTFSATDPKWSFAAVDASTSRVTAVAEKTPISTQATVGYYYWKHGADFVRYAEQMIHKNLRVNNEFYVCPVYNEAIAEGRRIHAFSAAQMWDLGTPDDLAYFQTHYRG